MKERSSNQIAISISLPKDVLAKIDARATAAHMTRSRYMTSIALQDVEKGGPLVIHTFGASQTTSPVDLTEEAYDFLLLAIPALEEYIRRRENLPSAGDVPEPPDAVAESKLWRFFLLEREEILKLKWLESEKAGRDIGLSPAIRIWLQMHRALWIAAHKP